THSDAGTANGRAFRRLCVGVHADGFGATRHCSVAIESAGAETLSGGPGSPVLLFLHQTVHHLGALRAWVLPGDVARGCMDCDSRLARLAHADSVCRSD